MVSAFSNFIARMGQNIQFVAFFAHAGVAALVVEHSPHRWIVAGAVMVAGGIKEYWFDARDETDPPQTFWDNTEDFVGWTTGAILGAFLA
jgi:hypothetical protein